MHFFSIFEFIKHRKAFAALRCSLGQLTELYSSLSEKDLEEILPEGQAKAQLE